MVGRKNKLSRQFVAIWHKLDRTVGEWQELNALGEVYFGMNMLARNVISSLDLII